MVFVLVKYVSHENDLNNIIPGFKNGIQIGHRHRVMLFHKHMWCLLCRTSTLCFSESIHCAQTVDSSPCGPWAVITFCQLIVKVNDIYVRFIAQSLPPLAASNNFSWEVSRLYT